MAVEVTERRRAASRRGAGEALGWRRAAEQLGLKPSELELGARLGEVRTVAGPEGRRRVPRAEVERLRAAEGFPDALRERVRAVATAEGAALMGIGQGRFTRLARVGCFSPVKFYVNRYRAVVWLYPAVELRRFAERSPELLTGGTPKGLRAMLEAGEDWRARNWRSRRIAQLSRESDDPWERAAVSAAVLGADQLREVVDDPYERAYLRRLRPSLLPLRDETSTSWPLVQALLMADDPDEILWHRISLALCLDESREERPAPRPGGAPPPAAAGGPPEPASEPVPDPEPVTAPVPQAGGPPGGEPLEESRSRGVRRWLRRGRR
ncbi:MAG TPA: hypothetical protein DEQ61_15180 [Streptomyces sp.]|nr:hypothetical protein [Streptomyces sp.]